MRKIVTQDLVNEIAENLINEGKEPTLVDVQARSGGSFTTVKKCLEIWQKKRSESSEIVSNMPPDIDSRARQLARAVWISASQNAQRAIDAATEKAGEEVAAARGELSEALNEISRLERIEVDLTVNVDEQQCRLREIELALAEARAQVGRTATLEVELSECRAKYDALQQEATERAAAFGRMEGEADTLRSQLRELIKAVKPQNANAARTRNGA